MTRYLSLIFHYVRLSWMRVLEYRTNYLTWSVIDIGWTIVDLLFFTVLIKNIGTIGNWTYGEALAMAGFFRLMVIPVWGWMNESFSEIPKLISEGKLDLILSKPINSQFLVSIRQFSFNLIPSLVGGLTLVIYGIHLSKIEISASLITVSIYLTLVSLILMYGIYFSTVAFSLYVDRLNNIQHIFPRLFDAGRFPKDIYPLVLQRIFTTILPIAVMLVVPLDSLFHPPSAIEVIVFHLLAIGFVLLSRQIWTSGLRHYSSVSS